MELILNVREGDEDLGKNDYAFLKERFAAVSGRAGYAASFVWEEIGSTNDEAKSLFASPRPSDASVAGSLQSAAFWAFRQTAGRGRLGRSWESPSGAGIYMSFVVPARTDIGLITVAAGVSMCLALRAEGFDARLKWPNDVLIGGKKVCGILSELILDDEGGRYVVVGAGLNLSHTFDGALAETAVSLKNAERRYPSAGSSEGEDLLYGMHLMVDSVGRTVRHYDAMSPAQIISAAKDYSATIGNEVEVHNVHDREGYLAIARDIDIDGALVVELPSGERRRVFAGEVTLKKRSDIEKEKG